MTASIPKPVFIDSPQGRIFLLHRSPCNTKPRSGIVLVPPFAEEMNKSRRMMTRVSEALAGRGFHVMLPDFYGTGDSDGDFSDASWDGWGAQLDCSIDRMRRDYGIERYSLLAVRSGALLAVQHLQSAHALVDKLALWQPVVDGGVYLAQFLRLRLASGMLSGRDDKETTQSLKQSLAGGEIVEVAGYGLTVALTDGLAAASLKDVAPGDLPPTLWMDVVASETQSPPLANRKLADQWTGAGVALTHRCCVGEPFWGGVEIVEIPALVADTVRFFCEDDPCDH